MLDDAATRSSAHDLELVAVAAAGGRAAFGELVRRHGTPVRALLRRMGADPALADDIAQDAFMAAFEQISDFRGEGTFAAWVKRIAARLYVKRWRRDRRVDLMALPPDDGTQRLIGEAGAVARIDLDGAMAALTAVERVCVSLCFGAGLSHAEVALVLNTPLGTIKSHVKRGMDKLRARLAPESSLNGDQKASRHG